MFSGALAPLLVPLSVREIVSAVAMIGLGLAVAVGVGFAARRAHSYGRHSA